jgi:hypothetical protein
MYWDITDEQRIAMDGYTSERIAELSAEKLEAMETLVEGHMTDYKIITRDRFVGVMRVGSDDGYHGPSIVYGRLIAGRWVDCDKHGRPLNES